MAAIKKVISELKSLKTFDIIWLVLFTVGITTVSLSISDSILAIIASIMGVIYVILNGCRLSVAFLAGIVSTLIYGIVSYQNGLYGNFMLNTFYSCPCCIIGLIAWFKTSKEITVVSVSSFKLKEKIIFSFLVVIAIITYGTILSILKDTQPYLDATTIILSIGAYICLILRKKEVWYLVNISNILSILMWGINYSTNDVNLSILVMFVICTINSLYLTVKWELSNKPLLEIDILFYQGKIDYKWIEEIITNRNDIQVNIYLYNQKLKTDSKKINIKNIPKRINTYGEAYNYIMSKSRRKYFMLLDNIDYLEPNAFNETITKKILQGKYQMIKSNSFYIQENNNKTSHYDDYTGTNIDIENKIMARDIFPYFFGCRLYQTKFIKKNKIKFNNTNMYNDVYPNILLARKLDMNRILIIDSLFYTRFRIKWDQNDYSKNDLKNMIESLISLDIPKNKILTRLVDSYNYSVNERNCSNQYFIDTIKEFYDINEFNKLLKERNNKAIYKVK